MFNYTPLLLRNQGLIEAPVAAGTCTCTVSSGSKPQNGHFVTCAISALTPCAGLSKYQAISFPSTMHMSTSRALCSAEQQTFLAFISHLLGQSPLAETRRQDRLPACGLSGLRPGGFALPSLGFLHFLSFLCLSTSLHQIA